MCTASVSWNQLDCCTSSNDVQAGVKHVVWSTLEDPRPFIDPSVPELTREPGRKVSHFETKEEIQVSNSNGCYTYAEAVCLSSFGHGQACGEADALLDAGKNLGYRSCRPCGIITAGFCLGSGTHTGDPVPTSWL